MKGPATGDAVLLLGRQELLRAARSARRKTQIGWGSGEQ